MIEIVNLRKGDTISSMCVCVYDGGRGMFHDGPGRAGGLEKDDEMGKTEWKDNGGDCGFEF